MKGRGPVEGVVIHKMGQLSQKRRCPPPKSPNRAEKGKLSAWKKRIAAALFREVLATNVEIGRVGAGLSKCFDVFTAGR